MSDRMRLAEKQSGESATGEKISKWGGARPGAGGYRPGAGRPKGSPNALHGDMKIAIVEAFQKAGGVDYLVGIAKTNPKAFCALIGRVLPLQVTGEGGGPIMITWGDE